MRLYRLDEADAEKANVLFWRAGDDPAIALEDKASYRTVAECKSIDDGRSVLLASSHDGVAIVDVATGKANFIASVGHAHSGDVAPNGFAVFAGASGERGGNIVALYNRRRSGVRLAALPLEAAHGVVYDAKLGLFWILARRQLIAIEVTDTPAPSMRIVRNYSIPSPNGHDLSWWGENQLSITTDQNCYTFNTATARFSPNVTLSKKHFVKSISRTMAGKMVSVAADNSPAGTWWSHRVLIGKRTLRTVEPVYKARWLYNVR